MSGFLFHEVIFGPVRSRRLGLSLGINLLPANSKVCTFNCIYCECGWTTKNSAKPGSFPSREEISSYLETRLQQLGRDDYLPDAITYAGNGEPTIHPEFSRIVDDTIVLRDRYAPEAQIAILSNASMLHKPEVFSALLKLDHNIQKLDAGSDRLFRLINQPGRSLTLDSLIRNLKRFEGNVTIQTMFLRGVYRGTPVDNTTGVEVSAWIAALQAIQPGMVMIYSIARQTPADNLQKVPIFELDSIAGRVRNAGLPVQVYP